MEVAVGLQRELRQFDVCQMPSIGCTSELEIEACFVKIRWGHRVVAAVLAEVPRKAVLF